MAFKNYFKKIINLGADCLLYGSSVLGFLRKIFILQLNFRAKFCLALRNSYRFYRLISWLIGSF